MEPGPTESAHGQAGVWVIVLHCRTDRDRQMYQLRLQLRLRQHKLFIHTDLDEERGWAHEEASAADGRAGEWVVVLAEDSAAAAGNKSRIREWHHLWIHS